MIFEIEGKCVIELEHTQGEKKSKLVSTKLNLDVGKNVDKSHFLGKDDLPTEAGAKALTQCFVQGLVGNIHYAHQKGIWDSAEHLRYIMSELERGFVQVANVSDSEF